MRREARIFRQRGTFTHGGLLRRIRNPELETPQGHACAGGALSIFTKFPPAPPLAHSPARCGCPAPPASPPGSLVRGAAVVSHNCMCCGRLVIPLWSSSRGRWLGVGPWANGLVPPGRGSCTGSPYEGYAFGGLTPRVRAAAGDALERVAPRHIRTRSRGRCCPRCTWRPRRPSSTASRRRRRPAAPRGR